MVKSKINIPSVLLVSCLLLILGSALKNAFYYPSFFDLFYLSEEFSEKLISGIEGDVSVFVELFNRNVSRGLVFVLLATGLFGFAAKSNLKLILLITWLALLFIFMSLWSEQSFQSAFLLENLLRLAIIPLYLISLSPNKKLYSILLKLCVLTFAGHGLYALNIFPRPGFFVDMVMKAFFFSEGNAILFLNLVGFFDLILVVAIFFEPLQKWVLRYMIFWGFLTTMARPVLNISWVFLGNSLLIWIPEFMIRFSHFLVPLALYFEWKKRDIRLNPN